MTEAEASTKACPLTLGSASPGKCIGSACMAWRVTGSEYTGRDVMVKTLDGGGRIVKETEPAGECGMVPECNK